jgi:hypothetical protein
LKYWYLFTKVFGASEMAAPEFTLSPADVVDLLGPSTTDVVRGLKDVCLQFPHEKHAAKKMCYCPLAVTIYDVTGEQIAMCPACGFTELLRPESRRVRLTPAAYARVFQCVVAGIPVHGLPDCDHLCVFFDMLHKQCNVPDYATVLQLLQHLTFLAHIGPIMRALYRTPVQTGECAIVLLQLIVRNIHGDSTHEIHDAMFSAVEAVRGSK